MASNNKKISTRQLVSMAMLGAISIVLVAAIHFPLIPAAAFLEYDPADIPILICAFAYGPTAGDPTAGRLAARGAAGVSHGVRVVCGFLHRGEFSDSDHFFNYIWFNTPLRNSSARSSSPPTLSSLDLSVEDYYFEH